ncbi:unnamed protein product [Sphenostylis stenocarpa]|uniref:Uncharacterized protein n=1 Tax=Sphenostylis stenocarpa TaxID=92480 RepID=A0AA86RWC9_9FABA|nr:unnamed protein product [Sphenostylis stenocarpa]
MNSLYSQPFAHYNTQPLNMQASQQQQPQAQNSQNQKIHYNDIRRIALGIAIPRDWYGLDLEAEGAVFHVGEILSIVIHTAAIIAKEVIVQKAGMR